MLVRFKHAWFGPNAHLYEVTAPGQFAPVPDHFRDVLPPGAEIQDASRSRDNAPAAPVVPVTPQATLRDLDHLRSVADAEDVVLAKAEETRAGLRKPRIGA
jgi:hypothetical protein